MRMSLSYRVPERPERDRLFGVIGDAFGPTVPSALEKLLFGGVQAGAHDLTLTASKRPYSPSPDPTAPVIETCTTHFSVIAK